MGEMLTQIVFQGEKGTVQFETFTYVNWIKVDINSLWYYYIHQIHSR